jgi:lipid-A-disaccharide synthase-like uncharacterized protein
VFEIIGAAGIAISMLAYLPQVVHLAREHCSAGISRRAWVMWLVSSLLIGSLALHRHDPVFILLQISSLISAAAILFLAHRYRGLICEAHMHSIPERWMGTDIVEKCHGYARMAQGHPTFGWKPDAELLPMQLVPRHARRDFRAGPGES